MRSAQMIKSTLTSLRNLKQNSLNKGSLKTDLSLSLLTLRGASWECSQSVCCNVWVTRFCNSTIRNELKSFIVIHNSVTWSVSILRGSWLSGMMFGTCFPSKRFSWSYSSWRNSFLAYNSCFKIALSSPKSPLNAFSIFFNLRFSIRSSICFSKMVAILNLLSWMLWFVMFIWSIRFLTCWCWLDRVLSIFYIAKWLSISWKVY